MSDVSLNALHERVTDLEEWRREDAAPALEVLGRDIVGLRDRLDKTASKEDILLLHSAVTQGNANMAAALKSVPSSERIVTWIFGLIGTAAMVVAAIAALRK